MLRKCFILSMNRDLYFVLGWRHKLNIYIKKIVKIKNLSKEGAGDGQDELSSFAGKKVGLCMPEGTYHAGHGRHDVKIHQHDLEHSIARTASEFFEVDVSNIWFDYFNAPQAGGNDCLVIKHTWVAAPINHLDSFRKLISMLHFKAQVITVPPVVICNALCVLSKLGVIQPDGRWLVLTEQSVCFISIVDEGLDQLCILPSDHQYIQGGIINVALLQDYLQQSLASELKDLTKKQISIIGENKWFINSCSSPIIKVDGGLFKRVEKSIFIKNNPACDHCYQKTLLYLLLTGLIIRRG